MSPVTILLSIHPEYAGKIFSGEKTIEFRKGNIPIETRFVVVYATAPVSKVLGVVSVSRVVEASPASLWRRFGAVGGICRDLFFRYYENTAIARGLVIESVFHKRRSDIHRLTQFKPPQSFAYVNAHDALVIFRDCSDSRGMRIDLGE